jgi:hypothetical protein
MMAKRPLPKTSVIDRRLANPFGSGTVPITLKTPGQWEIRVVYSKLRSGHLYNMTHHKGWVFVTPDEIDGTPEEYGLTVKDGRLCRGDHGEEVLMKMPLSDFRRIQKAKDAANLKGIGQKAMAEYAAQRTAVEHGSEAGDTVFNAFKHGEIKDSRGVDMELESEA